MFKPKILLNRETFTPTSVAGRVTPLAVQASSLKTSPTTDNLLGDFSDMAATLEDIISHTINTRTVGNYDQFYVLDLDEDEETVVDSEEDEEIASSFTNRYFQSPQPKKTSLHSLPPRPTGYIENIKRCCPNDYPIQANIPSQRQKRGIDALSTHGEPYSSLISKLPRR